MSAQDQFGETHELPPSVAMLELIRGFSVSRALYVAARLGIADLLNDGPRSSEELAGITGTHAPALHRVLRALASFGVFAEDDSGRFVLTPLASTLRTGVPGSLRAWALLVLGEEHYRSWGDLMHSVRTGETAFDHVFGMGVWKYRAQHPEHARIFDEAMSDLIGVFNEAVLASYPFSEFGKVVDVGGGDGSLMISLLKANPGMKGVVFDLPHVAERARGRIAAAGLAGRCEVVAGDVFVSVPGGADVYILSRVIMDWDDARSIAISASCRRAMPGKSRLLLIGRVLPARVENSTAVQAVVMSDLNMLVNTGGRERTETEYRALLEASGFRLTRIVPTRSAMNMIEAVPHVMP